MNNGEWLVKNGYKFSDVHVIYKGFERHNDLVVRIKDEKVDAFKSKLKFPELYEALVEWLDMEHVEPILDDVEKRYLKGVIRPFRNRIVFVRKDYHNGSIGACEQIVIRVESVTSSIADIPLPFFKAGEMYKGMKMYKEYTPEELGL